MKHSRVASYVPPSYSKNSPSSRPQSSTKNIDSSKGSKLAQADMNIRIQPYRSAQETSDKKHSPLSKERKSDLTANLYQVSRALDKDQQTYSKLYKNKETQQRKTQKSTIVSRPAEKLTEKLSIYQYVQSKSKKLEDYKSCLNLSNQVSSRASSRIVALDEQNESLANKACDVNVLPSKRLMGTANDSSQSKSKPKSPLSYHKNLSTSTIKGAQKLSGANGVKHIDLGQGSTNNLSFNEAIPDYSKTPDTKKVGGDNSVNSGDNFNEALANKLKAALQGLQGDLQNARHRRGLSTGQNSIFVEQEIVQEKIKPIELVPAPVVVAVDPQQEQDEFFERFFHSDQMTFEFEKLIVSQRNKPQKVSMTAATTPTNQKKPVTAHARTRSIDNQSSPMQTKTSSRWNTKRSSVGEEPQPYLKEAYNLIDKLSQLDRAEGDKDERQRYLRG